MILVVGATGQLGTAVVRRAAARGRPVRALVRRPADAERFRDPNIGVSIGDLRDATSLRRACEGATAVIATATVVFPRGRYRFEEDEGRGYRNLIEACRAGGVEQILFTSIVGLEDRYVDLVPTLRMKRRIERLIVDSGLGYTILRAAPFMDDYFALIGSEIPLRGAEGATLKRPFWMSRAYLSRVGRLVEDRGVALVPGPAEARHSFVAVDDLAELLVRAAGEREAFGTCFDVGGPCALSWREVVGIYAAILRRPVRSLSLPAGLLRSGMHAMRPFSEAAANQLGILWSLASNEIVVDPEGVPQCLAAPATSPEEFLRAKWALPQR